jgi:hypothetical protein
MSGFVKRIYQTQIHVIAKRGKIYFYSNLRTSVADPDPDPHVVESPGSGSGSIRHRYGIGSQFFYH